MLIEPNNYSVCLLHFSCHRHRHIHMQVTAFYEKTLLILSVLIEPNNYSVCLLNFPCHNCVLGLNWGGEDFFPPSVCVWAVSSCYVHTYHISAACVHSTYHTPNKEIVIGRCGILVNVRCSILMCSWRYIHWDHTYHISAACVHSTYHTPNKEIVIGRCGILVNVYIVRCSIYSCAPGGIYIEITLASVT